MLGSMMRRAMIGDDAKLSLDFTSTLPAGVTFTRAANTATRINSSGLVETMSADQPRFDHDPATGLPRGMLIESTATNLLSRSEEFNNTGSWFAFNRTVTPNDGVAPNGNTTADSIQATVSGVGGVYHATACPSGTHTFSVFAKANGANGFTISVDTSGNGRAVDFTLTSGGSAGTPYVRGTSGTVTSLTASVQTFQSGWVRCIVTVVTTGTNSVALYTQSGTSKWLAWGAQLEAGSGASSYIPTGASQATRNPDICTISGAAFSSWYNASEGTFFAHFRRRRTNNTGTVLSANDNTTAEVIELAADTAGKFNVTDGGASQVALFRTPFTANTDTKLAGAFKLNDCNIGMSGSIGTTDATATIPTVDRLFIGRDSGAVPVYLDGHIKTVKFYDIRKDDGKLQEMTA